MPLYYSSDGGASWAPAGRAPVPSVGSYEPIPGKEPGTLRNFGVLPYEWPSTPPPWTSFSSRNSTTFSVGSDGKLKFETDSRATVTFSNFPAGVGPCRNPHLEPNGWRLQGTAHVVTTDGAILQTVIACVGGSHHGTVPGTENATSILAFRSTDGGATFIYQSAIANATHYPDSGEGPNEHALTYLADGKTIMCMLRAYGDGRCGASGFGQQYKHWLQSFSTDGGRSFTEPAFTDPVYKMGCVRPRLLKLAAAADPGPLLLIGGRTCIDKVSGIFLWLNRDGMAKVWERTSLSYWHNRLWAGGKEYRFSEMVNSTSAWESQAYMSLLHTGDNEAVVTYNKYMEENAGGGSAGFAMRVTLTGYRLSRGQPKAAELQIQGNPRRPPPDGASKTDDAEAVPLALLALNFTDAAEPFLPPAPGSSYDSTVCMNPFILREGDEWRLFYAGADTRGGLCCHFTPPHVREGPLCSANMGTSK
jgi:hypothetical protein